ncbi:Ribosomal protein S18 acetylase RimI [Agreia bicolorata]|uniref:Ribosomal protein S18 acetylase RimI n=1 Tax=Agreia bicolorata TaxID=110935 RepID=A0A1T4X8J4_9MICO|nr:GNAT family N-acetyltransferase [Agreia bicolorata]SKA85769.1 Ribosomal protein S18 acetylase RimI [Agreia bicolorata]
MDIREARTDSPDAHRLLTDYFTWRAGEFPPAQGAYTITYPDPSAFVTPDGSFLVAVDDEPVGCGGIRRIAPDDAGRVRFEVKHLLLAPGSRGRGLAAAMMDELESRARQFGADVMVLDTHHTLTGAARLYAKRGYLPVDAYNQNPNATVWYAKDLSVPV